MRKFGRIKTQKIRVQTKELHNSIKKEFARLSNKKEFGVQRYTNAWMFNKLATNFYKSPKAIENIVFVEPAKKAKSSYKQAFR